MNRRNKNYHSEETIAEMRRMYRDGYSIVSIADCLNAGTSTVSFYCQDIERAVKVPLTNAERSEFMQRWK